MRNSFRLLCRCEELEVLNEGKEAGPLRIGDGFGRGGDRHVATLLAMTDVF
jgi:hypothetical protein